MLWAPTFALALILFGPLPDFIGDGWCCLADDDRLQDPVSYQVLQHIDDLLVLDEVRALLLAMVLYFCGVTFP